MSFGLNTGMNFGSGGFSSGFTSDQPFMTGGGGSSGRSNSGFGDWLTDFGKSAGKSIIETGVQRGANRLFDEAGLGADQSGGGSAQVPVGEQPSGGGSGGGTPSYGGGGGGGYGPSNPPPSGRAPSGRTGGSNQSGQGQTQQTGLLSGVNNTMTLAIVGLIAYMIAVQT